MSQITKQEYLARLVAAKGRAFPPLTPEDRTAGFKGWHERGYLPHCDYPGLTQFVTFRLADSMPASRRAEWRHLLDIDDSGVKRTQLETYLDRGVGKCELRDSRVANLCQDALLYFHNERYELLAWCVMPNHVHVLVQVWRVPLGKVIQSWKSFVATRANSVLGRSGTLWEPEYWDTFMRDVNQERTAIRYIEANPVKARLCHTAKDWSWSSAKHRDNYQRLMIRKE